MAVIGAAVISEGAVVSEVNLRVAEFESYAGQRVWQEIGRRLKSGERVDLPTLNAALPKDAIFILDCVDACYSVDLAVSYADLVRDAARNRRLKEMAAILLDGRVDNPLEYAQNEMNAILEGDSQTDAQLFNDYLDDYLAQIGKPKNHASSGFTTLDSRLNGFKPGALYIIGARPGVGKSVLAMQLAWGMARNANALPAGEKAGLVLFHSLEMSKSELTNRLMADFLTYPLDLLEKGKLDETYKKHDLQARRADLNRLFVINDSPGQSLASVRSHAKAWQRKGYPLKALVIDYLGLLKDVSDGRSLYESVSQLSTNLKRLAKELNVPVIALAQLNRGVEHRAEKAPTLADLRDSGSIEQDADVVMLLSRDKDNPELLILDVAKNRQGVTGSIRYHFDGSHSRLRELNR